MSHAHHPPPTVNDRMYESFYSGAVGGTAVALLFLALDTLGGRPLHTPSLLGGIVLGGGAGPAAGIDLSAVAVMTLIHFAGFGLFGFVAAALVRLVERRTEGSFIFPAIALFILLEGSLRIASATIMPGVRDILGEGPVLAANMLAAASMTGFLRHAHCSGEAETKASVTGALGRHGVAPPV